MQLYGLFVLPIRELDLFDLGRQYRVQFTPNGSEIKKINARILLLCENATFVTTECINYHRALMFSAFVYIYQVLEQLQSEKDSLLHYSSTCGGVFSCLLKERCKNLTSDLLNRCFVRKIAYVLTRFYA